MSIPVPKTRTAFYGPSPLNSPLRGSPPPPSSPPHDIWLRQRAGRPGGHKFQAKDPRCLGYIGREGHCSGALESALISKSRKASCLQELHFLHRTRESLVGKATRRKMPFLLLVVLPDVLFSPLHKSRQNCFSLFPSLCRKQASSSSSPALAIVSLTACIHPTSSSSSHIQNWKQEDRKRKFLASRAENGPVITSVCERLPGMFSHGREKRETKK